MLFSFSNLSLFPCWQTEVPRGNYPSIPITAICAHPLSKQAWWSATPAANGSTPSALALKWKNTTALSSASLVEMINYIVSVMHQSLPAVPITRATVEHLCTLSVSRLGYWQFYSGPGVAQLRATERPTNTWHSRFLSLVWGKFIGQDSHGLDKLEVVFKGVRFRLS